MRNLNTTCRVVQETNRHEYDCETTQKQKDNCTDQAWTEFYAGDLNDILDELIADQPLDARNIALSTLFPEHFPRFIPSEADFKILIARVIERRVEVLMS